MLSIIDPGAPATIAGFVADERIARLSRFASAGRPLQPVMQSIVVELGFESFTYCMSADAGPARRDTRLYVWTTMPREWVRRYDERGYIEVDPRMTMTYNRSVPFVWDAADYRGDPRCRDFLDDAARHGAGSGVAVSFRDPDHGRILVSMNSPITPVGDARRKFVAQQLGDILLLATSFHDLFMAHLIGRGPSLMLRAAPLSPREVQCLELAASGMTSVDIGIKLGITPRTANFHFSNIVAKLGVLNRKEAIAQGVAHGLIRSNPVTMGRAGGRAPPPH